MPYEVPVYVGHEYEHAEYDGQDYDGHGFEYPDEYELEESYGPYGAYGHQAMTGLAHATPSHAAYGPAAYPPYAEDGFAHAVRDTFARFDRNRSGRLDYRLGLNPKPNLSLSLSLNLTLTLTLFPSPFPNPSPNPKQGAAPRASRTGHRSDHGWEIYGRYSEMYWRYTGGPWASA